MRGKGCYRSIRGGCTYHRGRDSQGGGGTLGGGGRARPHKPRARFYTPPGAPRRSPPRRGHGRRMWGSRRRPGCTREGKRGHSSWRGTLTGPGGAGQVERNGGLIKVVRVNVFFKIMLSTKRSVIFRL